MAKKFNYEFNFHYILDGKEIMEEEAIEHVIKMQAQKKPA
jgi:hypothetical protein